MNTHAARHARKHITAWDAHGVACIRARARSGFTAGQWDVISQAWLVSEHVRSGFAPASLSQTFGLAYFVDALVSLVISFHLSSLLGRRARDLAMNA